MDDESCIVWAKDRQNYVKTVEIVRLCFKDAAKFGLNRLGGVESGQLFSGRWSTIQNFKPKIIEIGFGQLAAPSVDEFVAKLQACGLTFFKIYLSSLNFVQISALNSKICTNLCQIIRNSEKLSVCEISSVDEIETEVDSAKILAEILAALKEKPKLKAISFQVPLNDEQTNEWIDALKLQLRILRFDGPNGFKFESFLKIRNDLPCVEFLALQSFDRRIRDDEVDENVIEKPAKINIDKFFNKIEYVFCGLKMLFFDWNVVDSVCIFDDRSTSVCKRLHNLYKVFHLQFLAVLIYTPDDQTKLAADKMQEFFEKENEPDRVKVRGEKFSSVANAPTNFQLIFFGDFHYQARTKRMVEIVAEKRVSRPDLSHFCYIVDSDPLLNPDLTLEFAGFDAEAVQKRYEEAIAVE